MPPPLPVDPDSRPLICHVLFHLGIGGLENGVVNLVNGISRERFRQAIVCLSDATDFRERIRNPEAEVHVIGKQAGHDIGAQGRLFALYRKLRPTIVHSRNLGCLEAQFPAWLARVPVRVHGEHGWDVRDPFGQSRKNRWLRRMHAPLIHRYVPLSAEIEQYLVQRVGIDKDKMARIYNGVDIGRFAPGHSYTVLPPGFRDADSLILGAVGRMHGVKDQVNLAHAFVRMLELVPDAAPRLRLVLIGDGPLRAECEAICQKAGVRDQVWVPGARNDVPEVLRALDLFVLPSLAEGISNTILEAMATGLPVVATEVGGNPELVEDGVTGQLVPAADPVALAQVLAHYVSNPARLAAHGHAGRARVLERFSLDAMVARYTALYLELIGQAA